MKDLIIIGGSAAATAAGIYAARRNLNFKIITKEFGGEVATSGEIGNYPGFSEGIPAYKGKTNGFELAKAFRKHLEFYSVEVEEGIEVAKVESQKSESGIMGSVSFKILAKKGEEEVSYESKSIIIATGVHPRHLNISGEEEFMNKGVSYCTTCDGPLFKGKVVAVIGGGNSALEAGIMLSGIASKVYVLTINDKIIGEDILMDKLKSAENVEIIYNAETNKIKGENMVKSLEYKDKKSGDQTEINVDGIFVHIGLIPNSGFIENIKKNQIGEIEVNQKCETSVSGIFAAGDVTNIPYKQIVIAAGQGTIASLSVSEYLNRLK
jgi:NADH-dependent peroxiredoxin subunit F